MERFSFRYFFSGFSGPKRSPTKQRKECFTSDEFEKIAIVEKAIYSRQRGRVRYQGTYWYARVDQDICILPNTHVFVIGQEGLTLVVKPLPSLSKCRDGSIEAEIPYLRAISEQAVAEENVYQP